MPKCGLAFWLLVFVSAKLWTGVRELGLPFERSNMLPWKSLILNVRMSAACARLRKPRKMRNFKNIGGKNWARYCNELASSSYKPYDAFRPLTLS